MTVTPLPVFVSQIVLIGCCPPEINRESLRLNFLQMIPGFRAGKFDGTGAFASRRAYQINIR